MSWPGEKPREKPLHQRGAIEQLHTPLVAKAIEAKKFHLVCSLLGQQHAIMQRATVDEDVQTANCLQSSRKIHRSGCST